MLRDFWTYNDLTNPHFCPMEISEGSPCVVVVDNDDFKSDTLTGDATAAHRTNVMFIQPEDLKSNLVILTTDMLRRLLLPKLSSRPLMIIINYLLSKVLNERIYQFSL